MRILFFLLAFFITVQLQSQSIVNAYAKVTAITSNSVITLSNVNQTYHSFAVGEKIIIMQMQDDVIGSNTANNSVFGNLSLIGNAGRYEMKYILSRSPATGIPTSITVASPFGNSYTIGSNTSVQIISYRNLGSNFTTTANITGLTWNGNVGGVVAIEVTNTLTLNHSILANGIGFSGGAISSSADEACANNAYITNSNAKAFKGEGIYKNTNSNYLNGRAKILNGGGGGAQNNAGGGGGGNYTAGGDGGFGWTCTSLTSGFGLGALSLSLSISGTRIFMGGGGGGGQQNNGTGTDGGNGGGIILIKANTIKSNNTCASSLSISALGDAAVDSGNDGSGGGGAGGSIVIDATTFSITTTCPLSINASGGKGGSVTNSGTHGGGGGGGQGVEIFTNAAPTTNITSVVNSGLGGANDSGVSSSASPGSGLNGSGIIANAITVLPIELLEFKGHVQSDQSILLQWSTASEKNFKEFEVQRSIDAIHFQSIAVVAGHGTSSDLQSYQTIDSDPQPGLTYYRLLSKDLDLTTNVSPLIAIEEKVVTDFELKPNPVQETESLTLMFSQKTIGTEQIELLDFTGRVIKQIQLLSGQDHLELKLSDLNLKSGVYFVRLQSTSKSLVKKFLML
jgi:hypothetical protein